MNMKIELEALLYNSWGECENGWTADAYSVPEAIEKIDASRLFGTPDCEVSTNFKLYFDGDLVYDDDWSFLRVLAAREKTEREVNKKFAEHEILEFLYKKRDWIVSSVESTPVNYREEVVGIYSGTKYDVIEYCSYYEKGDSWYDYKLADHLN